MAKVLHIHLDNWGSPTNATTIQPQLTLTVADDSASPTNDIISPTINLKTLGLYKSAIQLNAAIVDAVKTYLEDSYSFPPNSYAATYLAGGYGLLSVL